MPTAAFAHSNHFKIIQEWNDDCFTVIQKYLYLKKFLADQQLSRVEEDMCIYVCVHMLKIV